MPLEYLDCGALLDEEVGEPGKHTVRSVIEGNVEGLGPEGWQAAATGMSQMELVRAVIATIELPPELHRVRRGRGFVVKDKAQHDVIERTLNLGGAF